MLQKWKRRGQHKCCFNRSCMRPGHHCCDSTITCQLHNRTCLIWLWREQKENSLNSAAWNKTNGSLDEHQALGGTCTCISWLARSTAPRKDHSNVARNKEASPDKDTILSSWLVILPVNLLLLLVRLPGIFHVTLLGIFHYSCSKSTIYAGFPWFPQDSTLEKACCTIKVWKDYPAHRLQELSKD